MQEKKGIIFVDWHGVLSTTLFWQSTDAREVINNVPDLRIVVDYVFSNKPLVQEWMRGVYNTKELIKTAADHCKQDGMIKLSSIIVSNVLSELLTEECKQLKMNKELLDFLRPLREKYYIVIATDNMDCFDDVINQQEDFINNFDKFLSSTIQQTLKHENAEKFFLGCIQELRFQPIDCILIDDSKDSCESFNKLGGTAILWKADEESYRQLKRTS